jgi:RhoGAP domain
LWFGAELGADKREEKKNRSRFQESSAGSAMSVRRAMGLTKGKKGKSDKKGDSKGDSLSGVSWDSTGQSGTISSLAGSAGASPRAVVSNGVFGLPLKQLVDQQGPGRTAEEVSAEEAKVIPKVVIDCVEWLRGTPGALETDGLFRIPGEASAVAALKGLYTDPKADVDLPLNAEVEAVASVLKLFFRELPSPPIDEQYAVFVLPFVFFPPDSPQFLLTGSSCPPFLYLPPRPLLASIWRSLR